MYCIYGVPRLSLLDSMINIASILTYHYSIHIIFIIYTLLILPKSSPSLNFLHTNQYLSSEVRAEATFLIKAIVVTYTKKLIIYACTLQYPCFIHYLCVTRLVTLIVAHLDFLPSRPGEYNGQKQDQNSHC